MSRPARGEVESGIEPAAERKGGGDAQRDVEQRSHRGSSGSGRRPEEQEEAGVEEPGTETEHGPESGPDPERIR